jgi:hypothetical protein
LFSLNNWPINSFLFFGDSYSLLLIFFEHHNIPSIRVFSALAYIDKGLLFQNTISASLPTFILLLCHLCAITCWIKSHKLQASSSNISIFNCFCSFLIYLLDISASSNYRLPLILHYALLLL